MKTMQFHKAQIGLFFSLEQYFPHLGGLTKQFVTH